MVSSAGCSRAFVLLRAGDDPDGLKKIAGALADALRASAELSKPAPARPTSPRRSRPPFDEAASVAAANRRGLVIGMDVLTGLLALFVLKPLRRNWMAGTAASPMSR
jgi:hypothetical protein